MIRSVVGLGVPIAAAWWLLHGTGLRRREDSRLATAALAAALGLGASSIPTFGAVTAGMFPGVGYLALDAVVWTLLAAAGWWLERRSHRAAPRPPERPLGASLDTVVRALCVCAIGVSFAVPVVEYLASPHGQWDAWAIWNQKARFMFRSGEAWTASAAVPWSAPGHPLFAALSVARLWAYAGAESTFEPALLSVVYGAIVVAMVMGTLGVAHTRAWVAGAVVAAPFSFSHLMAAQTADLPVGMFATLALALWWRQDRLGWRDDSGARSVMALCGVATAFAGWTKNEGLVFMLAFGCLVTWASMRRGAATHVARWAMAVVPMVVFLWWFKTVLMPVSPEYLAGSSVADVVARATSLDRHLQIATLMWPHGLAWGGAGARWSLPLLLCVVAWRTIRPLDRSSLGLLAVVAAMFASYYVTYVVTPLDLPWLVGTTFERLTLQVWPVLVLVAASAGAGNGGEAMDLGRKGA